MSGIVERVKIGGRDRDGDAIHLTAWTFECPQIREIVERWCAGEVLNACAGKTRLTVAGDVHRNDLDRDRDADTHHDVREIDAHLPDNHFDTVVFDPPYSAEMAAEHYNGTHIGRAWEPRGALANVTAPGGVVLSFGYNSDGLGGWDGWERLATYYFRTPNWSGREICLAVDRKGGSAPLVGDRPALHEQQSLAEVAGDE